MDSGDLSVPSAVPGVPALPVAQSYPTAASPADVHPAPLHPPAGGDPFGEPHTLRRRTDSLGKRIGGALAAVVALVAKFFAAIKSLFLLLPNVKLLTTAGTALVSVAAYSLFWGWPFAAGFVVLLFVHEMGHVIQLRREGIKASAPMFIPFLGAAIFSKSLGEDALAEARVGLAGPVLGTLGAAACLAVGEATNSDMLRALAYLGFFLNLFNLLPVVPLDGGRAMAAMAPWMWFVGFGALVVLAFVFPNPIILIIVLFGGMETWRRWQARKRSSLQQAAYYRVAPRHRLLVGAVYIGLIAALVLGMHEAHILTSAGHSFRTI
ncbi:MAG TPA: site-2 protease family protein [Solirubrobacteraceae bacterium]|nr:site-2 protease family protein [Solirubrobacteraceae bacterium]